MQYGQIVFLLFVALLFYYAALIVIDIQRAKAAQAAEQDNHSEEEIDISDEAQTFKPFKVSRDEPKNKNEESGNNDNNEAEQEQEEPTQANPRYREAIMTDGILVEKLIDEIERLVETGTCDLGTVIFNCENA